MDKEVIDYEQKLIELQEESNQYLNVVLEADKQVRLAKIAWEDAKWVAGEAAKKYDAIKQNIITTKKLLDATMR